MQNVLTLIISETNPVALDERLVNQSFIALEKLKAQIETVTWLAEGRACDIMFEGAQADDVTSALRAKLVNKEGAALPVDFIVQPVSTRRKKMLIADMDSTIINQECIDELADAIGIKDKVSGITERAMNGELDFKDALRERVALLKGLKESSLEEVYKTRITLARGAKKLVKTMAANGAHCRLVSGGFTFFTSRVSEDAGFHENEANSLIFEKGELTGAVGEPILDKESKLKSLRETSASLGISTDEVLAIGDGANDIPMLEAAGLGVACHAKPNVRNQISAQINFCGLDALLYAQGYKQDDIIEK